MKVPDKMKRRTEAERFAARPGGRSRQPRGVVDAARRRQRANEAGRMQGHFVRGAKAQNPCSRRGECVIYAGLG